MMQLMRKRLRTESGLTLIELIIASGLSLLVISVIAGIMISGFTAQGTVSTTNEAASQAQLAARQVETGIRQASVVRVYDGDDTESQLMVARTEVGSGDVVTWECRAWFYDDTAGAIFTATYAGNGVWPWASSIPDWIDLGSGITGLVDSGGLSSDALDVIFGGSDDGLSVWSVVAYGVRNETGSSDAVAPVFTPSGTQGAILSFNFTAGDQSPVLITTTATGRQAPSDTSPTCF